MLLHHRSLESMYESEIVSNVGPHPAQSLLHCHLYRSSSTTLLCCFSSTHSALLYSFAVVVNKACPLASCDLLLSIGEGIVEELCRSSAASSTASLLHLHKIDSGFLVKYTAQDWLTFHLPFDWIGLSWIGRFFFFFLHFLLIDEETQLAVRHGRGWSGLFLKVFALYDQLLWERETEPCVCQHNIQRREGRRFYGASRLFKFLVIVYSCSRSTQMTNFGIAAGDLLWLYYQAND